MFLKIGFKFQSIDMQKVIFVNYIHVLRQKVMKLLKMLLMV